MTGYLIVFGYLLVGLFLASIANELDCGEFVFGLTIFLWPVVLAILVLVGVLFVPIKLGELIGSLLKRL